jgi:RNA polymerase sigma factor (sigma-70 family)
MLISPTSNKERNNMPDQQWLAEKFEENRSRLRAVAYRMLGTLGEAEDAVQESWLRLSRSDAAGIENLTAWLTTVVARVCLDQLRSRKSRNEESLDSRPQDANPQPLPTPINRRGGSATRPLSNISDPEQEAILADSVGVALLIVLDRLDPAERVALVLHDLFGLSFEEIATIVDRSPAATRQLASRARKRVQGVANPPTANLGDQRKVIDAFLTALRAGDVEGLMAVLDPDLIVRVDATAARASAPQEVRGAQKWASGAVAYGRLLQSATVCLIDGAVGAVWAPGGHLNRVLRFKLNDGKITHFEVIADPVRLQSLELAVLPD